MRDVDADPAAVQALGGDDCRAATAERIKDQVALAAAGLDDAFEQGFGFLGRVTETLLWPAIDGGDVGPQCLDTSAPDFA